MKMQLPEIGEAVAAVAVPTAIFYLLCGAYISYKSKDWLTFNVCLGSLTCGALWVIFS